MKFLGPAIMKNAIPWTAENINYIYCNVCQLIISGNFAYNLLISGALAEKLGSGLQNRVDGSVTRRCLQFESYILKC